MSNSETLKYFVYLVLYLVGPDSSSEIFNRETSGSGLLMKCLEGSALLQIQWESQSDLGLCKSYPMKCSESKAQDKME